MSRVNLDEPRWDQSTYEGRARHFFTTTNPMNLLCTPAQLENARDVVTRYRTTPAVVFWQWINQSFNAVVNYTNRSGDSPISVQTTPAVVFWQWINQSFNAVVNYTNRSGDSPISVQQLGTSYVMATTGALVTALGLNSLVKSLPPLIGRLVPFTAVAAANCVNIPMMRMKEIQDGVTLLDSNGNKLGESKTAAKKGIAAVCVSRILMAAPGMVLPPIVMNALEKRGTLRRMPWISAPLQVALCGLCLTFATPACCALFPQKASIAVSSLEPEVQEKIRALPDAPEVAYYNKGL
ncbi:sideroflexin-1-like [Penaeus indicus]|uniref:sideroflexin-1-like n=1 Tax=Penaeus indicus TaxID=29960 RepID=UPI00300D0AEE